LSRERLLKYNYVEIKMDREDGVFEVGENGEIDVSPPPSQQELAEDCKRYVVPLIHRVHLQQDGSINY
jgi:hypothetical protein